jgi:SNF2 family DNA or RNA helicase
MPHHILCQDLPKKVEVIVPAKLSKLQKQWYRALLEKNYKFLKAGGKQSSALNNILMQLRKCANHPYLFEDAEPASSSEEEGNKLLIQASGKLMLLDRMLEKVGWSGLL